MKNAVLFAALTITIAAAAVLRLASLDNRLMHCDEANQADRFRRLLEHGEYDYDPEEHHGPSLNFLTLPIAWLASAGKLTQITETHLRLLPAIFGIGLVGLVWLVRDEMGRVAALFAAVLTAVSPAMVFYSRYYIAEMLLVGFTFAAIVALWRIKRGQNYFCRGAREAGAPSPEKAPRLPFLSLLLLGLCIGMMHATKETCVIPLFAMGVAAALTVPDLRRMGVRRILLSGGLVLLVAVLLSALLFSSFLGNPRDVLDSYATYSHYLHRASGEGSAGPQAHPWYHYLRILFWWHKPGGSLCTEGAIAALALVGLIAAALGRGLKPANLPTARFLAVYTVLMTVIYSAVPYKTPWSAMGFLHGMILLAGAGAAVLVRAAPGHALKGLAIGLLVAATGHLAWQAHRASFTACNDPGNPYAHTPTTRDVPLLAERVGQIAACHPDGEAMHIQVICADNDYWPLPWYMRRFRRIGWFDRVPASLPAPLIVTQREMGPAVVEYVYTVPPPGERPLYDRALPDQGDRDWELRRNVPLHVYVQRELLEASSAGVPQQTPQGTGEPAHRGAP